MGEEETYHSDAYVCTKKIGLQASLAIAGGVVSSCIFIIFFMLLMIIPGDKHSSLTPGIIGGFAVVPIFCFIYSLFMLKCITKVSLASEELILEGLISKISIPWDKISKLKRNKEQLIFNTKKVDVLVLCDENDKTLGRITGMLDNFPELVNRIEKQAEKARGKSVFDENEEIQRKQKEQSKNMRVAKYAFGFFTLMGLAMSVWGGYDYYNLKQLKEHGVEIQAKIVRHYIYNVTPRLEYSFETESGQSHTNDVMVERKEWDAIKGLEQIPVTYLPGNPEWNCLVKGEIPATEPKMMLLVGIACTILFGIFLGVAMTGLDLDTTDGKIKIVRAGEVSLDFEKPEKPPVMQKKIAPQITKTTKQGSTNRPKGIFALMVLNIVFGIIVLLLNLGRCAWALLDPDQMLLAVGILNIVFALTMVISAIGIFKLRSWGRITALLSAGGMILLDIVATGMRIFNYFIEVEQFVGEMKIMYQAAFVAALLFSLLGVIYPVVLLIILCKSSVKTRFSD